MFIKYKLLLLCAKWIPVVTAIGILVTNTIAYYGCNDIVVDIFNFNIGTSVAGVILMYVCSYAFNFCIWHKLVITYNALIIAIVFIIRYCITECSYSYLLLSYYILAGIIPKGKKEIGFNELSWSLKDFDGVKLQRIHKK